MIRNTDNNDDNNTNDDDHHHDNAIDYEYTIDDQLLQIIEYNYNEELNNNRAADTASLSSPISSNNVYFPDRPLTAMNLFYSMEYERIYGTTTSIIKNDDDEKHLDKKVAAGGQNNNDYVYTIDQVQQYLSKPKLNSNNALQHGDDNNNTYNKAFDDPNRTRKEKKMMLKKRRDDKKREQQEVVYRRNIILQRWNNLSTNEQQIFESCSYNEKIKYEQQMQRWIQQNPDHTVTKDLQLRQQQKQQNKRSEEYYVNDQFHMEEHINDDSIGYQYGQQGDILNDSIPSPEMKAQHTGRSKRMKRLPLPKTITTVTAVPANQHGSSLDTTNDNEGMRNRFDSHHSALDSNIYYGPGPTSTGATVTRNRANTTTSSALEGRIQPTMLTKNVLKQNTTSIQTLEDNLYRREMLLLRRQHHIEKLQRSLAVQQYRYDNEKYELDCLRTQYHQSIMLSGMSMNAAPKVPTITTNVQGVPYHNRTATATAATAQVYNNRHSNNDIAEYRYVPILPLPPNAPTHNNYHRQVREVATRTASNNQRQLSYHNHNSTMENFDNVNATRDQSKK
jgi:hypothetical protein